MNIFRYISFIALIVGIFIAQPTDLKAQNSGVLSFIEEMESGITDNLRAVSFINADTGWVAGDAGTLLKTEDGGMTWSVQSLGETWYYARSLFFIDQNTGWVAFDQGDGQRGGILRTDDGGTTWTTQSTDGKAKNEVTFADADIGWAAGQAGGLHYTTDGGSTWNNAMIDVRFPRSRDFNAVTFINSNLGWAVGTEGNIQKSTDGGANWDSLGTGYTNDELYSVSFIDVDSGWVAGSSGLLLQTTDGGATWTRNNDASVWNSNNTYTEVHFANADTGWLAGTDNNGSGLLLQTNDGGATWAVKSPSGINKIEELHFYNENEFYTVGLQGEILKRIYLTELSAPLIKAPNDNSELVLDIELSWESEVYPQYIDFNVHISTQADFSDTLRYEPAYNNTSLTLSESDSLLGNKTYYWRVRRRASNVDLASSWVERSFTVKDITPPITPSDLAASASASAVELSWPAIGDNDLKGYNLYRSTSSFQNVSNADKLNNSIITGTSFIDDAVVEGITYYYRITAEDNSDNESAGSPEVVITFGDITPPAAPVNLSASTSSGLVELSWSANSESDLKGYSVYRSTTSFQNISNASKLNSSILTTTGFSDNAVTNGTTYYYRITAEDHSGNESAISNEVTAKPTSSPGGGGTASLPYTVISGNEQQNGRFGYSLDTIGDDLDGDGVIDFVVGAPTEDSGSLYAAGRVYIYSGANGSLIRTLQKPYEEGQDNFGFGLASVGDLDGDFVSDIVVLSDDSDQTDNIHVFSGNDGSLIRTLYIKEKYSAMRMTEDYTSSPVTGIDDLNGDGVNDVIVGTPEATPDGGNSYEGKVYIFSGADGSVIRELVSPNTYENVFNGHFGSAVSSVGDVNGDGTSDIVIGAVHERENGDVDQTVGRAYIFSGSDGSVLQELASPNAEDLGGFGSSVNGDVGDINGNGWPDVLVGAFTEGSDNRGRAYLFDGATGSLIYTLNSPNPVQTGLFGKSVQGLNQDIDQDGVPDIAVGAHSETAVAADDGTTWAGDAGQLHLFSGADGSLIRTFISPSVSGVGAFGWALTSLQDDLDGDGINEIIVGAHLEYSEDGTLQSPGRVYVFSTADSGTGGDNTNDTTPPATPTNLNANQGSGTLEITWDGNQEGDLAGYNLYRFTSSFQDVNNASLQNQGLIGGTRYSDDGVNDGVTYYYRVTAVDTAGNESLPSAEASETFDGSSGSNQIMFSFNRSFGSINSSQGYRLVAIPGDNRRSLSGLLEGDPGVDWQAFWDDGSDQDYRIKYDGSATFDFRPGNGFWVISKNNFEYYDIVSAVALNNANQATIALQDGWNIISNPLDVDVAWNDVESANGSALQPIWDFNGSFSRATDFNAATSGKAFYFFNDTGLQSLLIPYSNTSSKEKLKNTPATLRLLTSTEESVTSTSDIVFDGMDRKIVAPPGGFESASLRFVAPGDTARSKRSNTYAAIHRPLDSAGQQFTVQLRADPGVNVAIEAKKLNLSRFHSMVLVDKQNGQSYDLGSGGKILFTPEEETTLFDLIIGGAEFVKERQQEYLPKQVEMMPNYPNPFNPSTTLKFALPEEARVSLSIYNIIGQKVATLLNNEIRPAGVHTLRFDGSRLASGTYFNIIEINGKRLTQKMMLIK